MKTNIVTIFSLSPAENHNGSDKLTKLHLIRLFQGLPISGSVSEDEVEWKSCTQNLSLDSGNLENKTLIR